MKIRRFRNLFALAAVGMCVVVVGLGSPRASAVPASSPGYFLRTEPSPLFGPCYATMKYLGDVTISPVTYSQQHRYTVDQGNWIYDKWWQFGFNRAYKYFGCLRGGYGYYYYGADDGKIRRERTVVSLCYGDSCVPSGTTYTGWSRNDWH
jgi:hypothetical protein